MSLLRNTCLIGCIVATCLSCKTKTEENNKNASKVSTEKMSLSQIQKQNANLINSYSEKVISSVLDKDISTLYAISDTSLQNEIDEQDLRLYFDLIEKYYGKLYKLDEYGTIMTADLKTYDFIGRFESGDTLELRTILSLYPQDVKLSYIGYTPFKKDKVKKGRFYGIEKVVALLKKQNASSLYGMAIDQFKNKISEENFQDYLKMNLSKTPKITITACKVIIFERGKVGLLAMADIENDTLEDKETRILMYQENDEMKIADIQFKKKKTDS